ncbi:MAG: MFS transporter [Chitinispirillia bacterium]|jgi:EmrB/QacA subfamily drug resistance transporter
MKSEKKWVVLQAVMIGSFITPLDSSIVNTILPFFVSLFQTDISIVQWIPTVYLLTISSLILLFGRLGDIRGHKAVFLTGLAGFTCASLLCGIALNIWMLIIFRSFQGIFGAMLMSVGPAIITEAFPPHERGKALGISATSIAVALALGPTLGGLITEYLHWRMIFILNIPVGIFGVIFGLRTIPEKDVNKNQTLDWKGAMLIFFSLFSLLLFANRGVDWGWFSPVSVVLFCFFCICFSLFIFIERSTTQPLINLSLFRIKNFTLGNISLLLHFITAFTVIFLLPFYLITVLKLTISQIGFILAAYPVVMLFVSPVSGTISDYIGTRLPTSIGMIICSISLFLFSMISETTNVSTIIFCLLLFSLANSIYQSPNSSIIMGSVPKKYLGISSGMLANMRNLGMVLGIALSGTIFYSIAPAASQKQGHIFNPVEVQMLLSGFRWAFLTGAGIAFVNSVISSLIKTNKLTAGKMG